MRLWSLDPKYLDAKGLVALWREGLLAKKVLQGKTKGYKNHPQLLRFKESNNPIKNINIFLTHVWEEANNRGYNFDFRKIKNYKSNDKLFVNDKQLEYEFGHLQNKLKIRDQNKFKENQKLFNNKTNKIFKKKKGPIESWENIN